MTSTTTPTTTTPNRRAAPLPAEQRRSAIIQAVLPLFIERGVTVTTREIAHVAGVSEGTLFNVFRDKDALIAAAVEAAIDREPFERAVEAIDADRAFDDRLVAATELIQRRVVDVWKLISQLGPTYRPDANHAPLPDSPALTALFDSERDRLRESPAEAARLLRALTLALTHPLMTAEPRRAADIVDVFLNGVTA